MRTEEELEQLRAEKASLGEALQGSEEALHQSQQTNKVLRAGLKEAIAGLEQQQEHIKALERYIDSFQERLKTLEGQQCQGRCTREAVWNWPPR